MPRTSNIFARVEPEIKQQAEKVLEQLGIPMSSAIGIFLRQVVLQRGLPFDMKLPANKPLSAGSLSEEQFNAEIEKGLADLSMGKVVSADSIADKNAPGLRRMSDWRIIYSERAENDLREIYEYIAYSLLEPGIAKNQTKRIMDAVVKLSQLPLRHHLYKQEPWSSKGLRVLRVDNYMVFYLPVDKQNIVAIIRIMYGGRNIEEQLHQTDKDT